MFWLLPNLGVSTLVAPRRIVSLALVSFRPAFMAEANLVTSYNSHETKVTFTSRRVNIEEQDANGMTPVMIAAEAGREKNVDLLLKTASNSRVLHVVNVVERPDRSNRSAIHYAASNGHAVRILYCRCCFRRELKRRIIFSLKVLKNRTI